VDDFGSGVTLRFAKYEPAPQISRLQRRIVCGVIEDIDSVAGDWWDGGFTSH
jgi:hypothetical protein